MPLVTARSQVLELYAEAAERGWVIPCFGTENLTTTEAVLSGAVAHGRAIGCDTLPITLAITNQYAPRTQSAYYTQTRRWDIGLQLFMADLGVLTAPGSPFERLRVMTHLDHAQHDADQPLFTWDLQPFSSIMFDASALPLEANMEATARFVETHRHEIVIEGACDEIGEAASDTSSALTSPESAQAFLTRTGVDFLVVNLGTEHRAPNADQRYHGALARRISALTGPILVLHGCSSVPTEQLMTLFQDGICKVNIWTTLERDSSPLLLREMLFHAAKIVGPEAAHQLMEQDLLGAHADLDSRVTLSHCTTAYRQEIVFNAMRRIVTHYLALWYRQEGPFTPIQPQWTTKQVSGPRDEKTAPW